MVEDNNIRNVDFSKLIDEKIDNMLNLVNAYEKENVSQAKSVSAPVQPKEQSHSKEDHSALTIKPLKIESPSLNQAKSAEPAMPDSLKKTQGPKILGSSSNLNTLKNTQAAPKEEDTKKVSSLKLSVNHSGDSPIATEQKQEKIAAGKIPFAMHMKEAITKEQHPLETAQEKPVSTKPEPEKLAPEKSQLEEKPVSEKLTSAKPEPAKSEPEKPVSEEKAKMLKSEETPKESQELDIHQLISQAFFLDQDEEESDQQQAQPQEQPEPVKPKDPVLNDNNILKQADALAQKAQDYRYQSKDQFFKKQKDKDVLELKEQDVSKENLEDLVLSDDSSEESKQILLSQKDLHTVIDKISKKQSKLELLRLLADETDETVVSDIQKKLKKLDNI